MTARASALAVAACLATASLTAAQPNEPLPRFAADVRGASVGLPTGEGWTPAVPAGVQIPGRTLGLEAGGHVYLVRFSLGGIGLGATLLTARGKTTPPDTPTTGTAPATPATPLPDVTTRLTSLVPQISFNFGHRLGWSYLSGGLGRTRVRGEVSRPASPAAATTTESDWVNTLNYGGGARWFINDHLAFSLDLRFYKVARVEATSTRTALPRQSLLVAGAGISIK